MVEPNIQIDTQTDDIEQSRQRDDLMSAIQDQQQKLQEAQIYLQKSQQEVEQQETQKRVKIKLLQNFFKELEAQQAQLDQEQKDLEKRVYEINELIEKEEKILAMNIPSAEKMESEIQTMNQELNQINQNIRDYEQRIQEKAEQLNMPITGFRQINPLEFYDIILGFTNLSQLFDGIPYYQTQRNQNEQQNQRRIAMVGWKGRGKTFNLQNILNQEDNQQRRQHLQQTYGSVIETKGISVIVDKNEMYFDMQAMSDSVQYFAIKNPETRETYIPKRTSDFEGELIKERNYRNEVERMQQEMNDCQTNLELFIRNFVISQCQILIIVVSILTFDEQSFILDTMQKYPNKQIFIIHNIQEVENLDQLNRKIQSDITNCYQCEVLENLEVPNEIDQQDPQKRNKREIAPKIYLDTASVSRFQVQHLVIGQQHKESGVKINILNSLFFFRNTINMFTNTSENQFKIIPHVCHEFSKYNLLQAFNKYFKEHITNHFNFHQAIEAGNNKDMFLNSLQQEGYNQYFELNQEKNKLIIPSFANVFKNDFLKTKNFIKHPLQINYITGSGEHPYYLCENDEEIDLFIPIPFKDPNQKIWRKFSVSKSFEIDQYQFEFKYRQREENINQEVYYLINICPMTQNLKEFQVQKSNGTIVKRFFKDIITPNSKLAGYKHYQFIKVKDLFENH